MNAGRMKPEVLLMLMRHKSNQTTQKFHINPTSQLQDAESDISVPDALKKERAGKEREQNSGVKDANESKGN